MKTQRERVLAKLKATGSVDNFFAINNYILRLGDIIFRLKKKGWKFEGNFGRQLGKPMGVWRNYYYKVVKVGK